MNWNVPPPLAQYNGMTGPLLGAFPPPPPTQQQQQQYSTYRVSRWQPSANMPPTNPLLPPPPQTFQQQPQTTRDFIMSKPSEQITSDTGSTNVRVELERLRKDLIQSFYESGSTKTSIVMKRKLGILTNDVCDYYRYRKTPYSIPPEEFSSTPSVQYDSDTDQPDLLQDFTHSCVTCPLNLIPIDDPTATPIPNGKLSPAHVYMCDMCHCTRTVRENMTRHLETEEHLSASDYLAYRKPDSLSILTNCCRRTYLTNEQHDENDSDSYIVCPICFECFTTCTSCALHTNLLHGLDYVYSIAQVTSSQELSIKRDHDCVQCLMHFKKLTLLVKHMDEVDHGPKETDTHIPLLLCSQPSCNYRTKRFFNFKTHLMLMHNNAFHPVSFDVKIKVKLIEKPKTFMHISRFLHQTKSDIQEELQALKDLEENIKHLSDNGNMAKIIKTRYELIKNL